MKRAGNVLMAAIVATSVMALPAQAEAGKGLSEASELSALGVGSIVAGSFAALAGSAELVVESIEWLAEGCSVVLQGSVEVGRVVLIIPAAAVSAVALVAGATVVVVAEGAGWLVTRAGRVLAYVPDQRGQSLLFSEPYR